MSIYTDDIQTRIKRLKADIQGRDYEGTTTVLTSDIIEVLNHIKKSVDTNTAIARLVKALQKAQKHHEMQGHTGFVTVPPITVMSEVFEISEQDLIQLMTEEQKKAGESD